MMDNVQNCDSYINVPSSQTYRNLQKYRLVDEINGLIGCFNR
jgi:hypothetical protein